MNLNKIRHSLKYRNFSLFSLKSPVGTAVRLRCPAVSLSQAPASPADRGTHCALPSSATGGGRARGLDGPLNLVEGCGLEIATSLRSSR